MRLNFSLFLSGSLFVASGLVRVASGAALVPGASAPVGISFNSDIRPILAENCFFCHGPDPGTRKAGLRLDTEAGLFEKRKDEPAPVVRGKSGESELYKRLLSTDKDEVMPPPESHKTLKPIEVALLKRWIDGGAPWQKHWSFIAPEKAPLPQVKNAGWAKNPLDQIVLARLEALGLEPAPEADARTLFRRLHLDLTGLPPQPEAVEAFVADYAAEKEQAISDCIDRLMHTAAWGEHRARYWLDAARYGDTHGLHIDNYREMWLYRDWVIRAFNSNKLFSDFTMEQIAGDLLPAPREDQLIATGFQRCNITTSEGGTIAEENLAMYASDRVQTMGWVYLGLTMNCSQCHDHKFDPITQRDYYSMAAFFRNTTQGAMDGNAKDGRGPVLVVPFEGDRARWTALPGLVAGAGEAIKKRKVTAMPEFQKWLSAATPEVVEAELPHKGLVVRAPLNEGTGRAEKVFGGAEVAPVLETAGQLEWKAGGKLGAAPVFKAGVSVSLGDVGDFELKQGFSYGAWVKVGKLGVNGSILARMDAKQAFRGYDLYQADRGFAVHIIDSFPDNALKLTTGNVAKPGTWQHVFVTYDGSGKEAGVKVFVDGKEEKLKAATNSLKPTAVISAKTPLLVGQRSSGAAFEEGSVQDVRVYARALPAADVKALVAFPTVLTALTVESEKRSAAQKEALLEHFFSQKDEPYRVQMLELARLEAELNAIKDRGVITHIQKEVPDKMPVANIMIRGQYNKLGDEVEALPPAALHPLPEGAPKNRLGLAQWLVDKKNPLTPRVTVNRFWQEVFGQGLVRTSEDFGLMGMNPSHGELLDWLAADFRDNGGDVRGLFKLMLSSATYRQSALVTATKLEKDRDNAFLSRGPRFRMDAEMVRDYALSASGLMSSKIYGPSVRPYQPEGVWEVVGLPGGDTRNYKQDKGEALYRRALYTFWKRMAPPATMDVFNAPSREVSCVRRERTNTPLQALATLNDTQFVEAARHLAEHALLAGGSDGAKAMEYIVQRALGRAATAKEREILLQSSKDFLSHYTAHPEDAAALLAVGESRSSVSIAPASLAAWTMVCNQVLNLDEVLNK
jgi:Protein of unknown function (DUF1553)/Protein of unknown function (DUF1549)/Concanavalin A-like lectin/glucanases superfamily/Planctomycete cytochrome C